MKEQILAVIPEEEVELISDIEQSEDVRATLFQYMGSINPDLMYWADKDNWPSWLVAVEKLYLESL